MDIDKLASELDYREVLLSEFEHRKERNPSYSLRSYARDLSLSPSRLSEILRGKGDLSASSLMEVGGRIGIPTEEILALQASLSLKNSPSEEVKRAAEKYLHNYAYQTRFSQLTTDTFKILADWYHFALLSAMELRFYDGSTKFLARVLRLEEKTVIDALERMLAQNMVRFQEGRYFPTGEIFSTSNDLASDALRESHKQNLDLAKASLDEVDVSLRDITSATLCIDVARLPEAKKLIKDFRRSLSRFLEAGNKDAVYNLNIQLHPLSEILENEKSS